MEKTGSNRGVTIKQPATFPVDLHVHSLVSDGTDSPAEVVKKAISIGIRVLAITDHDSVAGVKEALAASRQQGITMVPGLEISIANEPENDFLELHLLGYWIDHENPELLSVLELTATARLEQKIASIRRMQEMGLDVPIDEVLELAQGGVPGRAHIAQVALGHNPQHFSSMEQIFQKCISFGGPAYVPRRYQLSLAEAIGLIHRAGGVSILAHPGLYHKVSNLPQMLLRARKLGLTGVEASYPYTEIRQSPITRLWIREHRQFILEMDFLATGGSDYHGERKNSSPGEQGLTLQEYSDLIQKCRKRGISCAST